MKIISLHLTNFQRAKDLRLQLDGRDADVYGDNAAGKTTIFNAFTWLLFGKDSTGAAGFTPKTRGPGGEDLHYLDHGVECVIELDDGRHVTLKKVYREVYTKKRGSTAEEFSGHTTDFYIDGVPAKEKEYANTLEALIGPPETLRMLSVPLYFPEAMSWDARRRILLEVCGDITDDEVIAATPALADLPAVLQKPGASGQMYTTDEYRKIAAAKRTEINKRLQEIPGRIDEATRAMPNIGLADAATVDARIDEIQRSIERVETDRASAAATVGTDTQRLISEAQAELAAARVRHVDAEAATHKEALDALAIVRREKQDLEHKLRGLKDDLTHTQVQRTRLDSLRESLLEEYRGVLYEAWDDAGEICRMCGQALPREQMEALQAEFNARKSKELERINARGQRECSQKMISALDDKSMALQKEIGGLQKQMAAVEDTLKTVESAQVSPLRFEDTAVYEEMSAKIDALKARQGGESASAQAILSQYDDRIAALRALVQEVQEQRTQITLAETQRKRIAELGDEEKRLAAEFEEIEHGIYLCEEFTRSKVSMLDDRINGKFQAVRFRLFVSQVNGGIKEDCEVLVPSEDGALVPFSTANNGGRINAGMEIIDTLANHYGISMPVFVDNAESVTRLRPMDAQVIRLIVSEADKRLRVEVKA